jgi:hypothetical protein
VDIYKQNSGILGLFDLENRMHLSRFSAAFISRKSNQSDCCKEKKSQEDMLYLLRGEIKQFPSNGK